MDSIRAIYDGTNFILSEPITIEGKYEVDIIFKKLIEEDSESKIKNFEQCFGIIDSDYVKMIEEIVEERWLTAKDNDVVALS